MCVSCVAVVQDIDTKQKGPCRGGLPGFRTGFKIQMASFPATLRCLGQSVRLPRSDFQGSCAKGVLWVFLPKMRISQKVYTLESWELCQTISQVFSTRFTSSRTLRVKN